MQPQRHQSYLLEFQPPDVAFTLVPNAALEDRRLSIEARGALCWMSSRPRGWRLAVGDAQEALGCGRDRWQRICRELRSVGALERRAMRASSGQVLGWLYVVSWAPWTAPESVVRDPVSKASAPTVNRETRQTALDLQPEKAVDGSTVSRVSGKTDGTFAVHPVRYQDLSKTTKNEPEKAVSGDLASEAELCEFYGKLLNGGGFLAPSVVRPDLARMLVARGVVAPERLRALGVCF